MREIRFRGKPASQRLCEREELQEFMKDGWVYGYLIGTDLIVGEAVSIDWDGVCPEFGCSVDPATVGQLTGLKDKNGREIYEGDIVLAPCAPCGKDKRSIKQRRCEVRWSDMGMPGWKLMIVDYQPGEKWATGYLDIGVNGNAFEVIGNIHEHAHLLGGDQRG